MSGYIINKVAIDSSDYLIGSTAFAVSTTAAATAAKTASTSASLTNSDLAMGLTVHVYFQHGNTATSPTLAIDSATAKPIAANGATTAVSWSDDDLLTLTYDGTNWVINNAVASVSVTQNVTGGIQSATVGSTNVYTPYWRVIQSTSGDTTTYTLQYSLDGGSNFSDYDTFTATDTTYSAFNTTTAGLVPAPTSANTGKFLKGDATWADPVTISNTLSSGTRVATINGTDILAPSGGGGGADLTFGGGTVTVYTSSLTATIVMDTTQRSYAILPVDSTWASPASGTVRTVSLSLNLANDYENYILVKNSDTVNSLSITIGSVVDSSSATISNVILPDGGITEIPKAASANAPNYVEFSIVPFSMGGTTYCVITSSAVLK